jgi:hypothetical protein
LAIAAPRERRRFFSPFLFKDDMTERRFPAAVLT